MNRPYIGIITRAGLESLRPEFEHRMAFLIVAMSLTGVAPATARAQEDKWAPEKAKESQ
jgi:hypothetical protein